MHILKPLETVTVTRDIAVSIYYFMTSSPVSLIFRVMETISYY